MQMSARESIVIISGLLAVLVLGAGALGVAFHNGTLRTAIADRGGAVASPQPTRGSNQAGAAPLAEVPDATSAQGGTHTARSTSVVTCGSAQSQGFMAPSPSSCLSHWSCH